MRGVGIAAALVVALASAASADPLTIEVSSAVVSRDADGMAGMTIVLAPESAAAFAALTAANIGKTVTIQIDGETVLSAVIRDAITGGQVRVSGGLSFVDLTTLALRLSDGTAKVAADVSAP
jgi:preprotein translocase subunit SecD